MASGDPTGNYGVVLIVTPEVANRIEDFKPINNRMAHMTVNFGREKAIFMILYATQQGRTDEEKEEFFGNVQTEIDNIKSNKEVIVKGDLNGHVGTTRTGYEQAIGHQGIGESNAEGKRIVDFCVDGVQQKEYMTSSHRSTCSYLQIKNRIRNVKAIPSVSLDSDHRLVLMNKKYRVQKCRPSVQQKRVDLQKLKDCSERENLQKISQRRYLISNQQEK